MATNWMRSSDIVWEDLNDEALLVDAKTGRQWSLNAAAARIWRLCDGSRGMAELAAAFALATGRTLKRSKVEIHEFCSRFTSLGLLLPVVSTGAASTFPNCAVAMTGLEVPPSVRPMNVGASGPRRRPSPRGNSGPG